MLMLLGIAHQASAQEIIIVSGKVMELPSGVNKPQPFPVDEAVYVLAYNTVAAARDALEIMNNNGESYLKPDAVAKVESDGYYEIRVAESGGLIFRIEHLLKNEFYEVKGKDELNVVVESARKLPTVVVTEKHKEIKVEDGEIQDFGDFIVVSNKINIPEKKGADNRRLIMQPYLQDCNIDDSVTFLKPIVYNGKDYKLTQERRMGFDMTNDILEPYFQKEVLTEEPIIIRFNDTINKPDPQRKYHVMAKSVITDYTTETYDSEWKLSSCRVKEPLRFLEFSLPDFKLNPEDYKETPKQEKRNTAGNISLNFEVNSSEFKKNDPNNELQMAKLDKELEAIIRGEGTMLNELKITGISSPEGTYERNLTLAKSRTATALKKIMEKIPAYHRERIFVHKPDTKVASWNDVANILEQDTLMTEATEIRSITQKYEKPDAQFAAIRKLPYYETVIKERLPLLRTVKYEYQYTIRRELTPEEILDRYQNDADYKSGKKQFTKYEYWHLFQMIKDKKEAEQIYKRAYEETMAYNSQGEKVPWILAANNWAVSLLERDTFDIEILKPLINIYRPVNTLDEFKNGIETVRTVINPENVVANQLAMYIRAKKNKDAAILATKLPDTEKFKTLKAFSRCLRGHYNYWQAPTVEKRKEYEEVFELVKNSSPINHVVICMAMKTDEYDKEAKKVLEEELPQNTLTKYLALQLFLREKNLPDPMFATMEEELDYKEACKILDEIIKEDSKYKRIAENDGEFSEAFIKYFNDPMLWQY